ncbi:MAG: hypothetical protein WBY53_03095 [Acidobacteriaceae bacterium]
MRASHPTLALRSTHLTLLLALPLLCAIPQAQSTPAPQTPAVHEEPGSPSLTIHILNAKNGKPMRRYELRAEFQGSPIKTTLTADKQGIAHLDIPPNATAVSLIAATRKDHPDQPAYTVCGPFGQFLPIATLLTQGFVPQNACSDDLHLTPHPGEVYYLVEPLPWYHGATE